MPADIHLQLRPRRTRVKTGCVSCRQRRKKCDERKPICKGCERNGLSCSWKSSTTESGTPLGGNEKSLLGFGEFDVRASKDLICTSSERGPEAQDDLNPPKHVESPTPAPLPQSTNLPPQEKSRSSSLSLGLRLPEMFGTASLKHPTSRILFEHYIKKTSHLLSAIRGPENPFITCILPLARVDSMIMNSVLAISGAHLSSTASGSDIKLASSTHYALVLSRFKDTLAKRASGKLSNTLHLLLTALLLCQIECISGHSQRAIFYHLRACSEFVRQMLATPPNELAVSHEMSGFVLEMYSYLVSVANITSNTTSDPNRLIFDPYTSSLLSYRSSNLYGVMLGCAQDLFGLIPSVCEFGHLRLRELQECTNPTEGSCSFETIALYNSLQSRIQSWQATNQDSQAKDLLIAAKIYQQSLLVFLHCNFYGPNTQDPTLHSLIDTSLNILMSLVLELNFASSIMTTLLWPSMIAGSCLTDPADREFFLQCLCISGSETTNVKRSLQTLKQVWEDEEAFGPHGVGLVMKKYRAVNCMG